jgi:hypothetical protein
LSFSCSDFTLLINFCVGNFSLPSGDVKDDY